MAWSLAGAALLMALSQGIATATTITVTTDNPNIVADGQCSLIEAIVNANNDAATHADCAAGNGADTIVLPADTNIALSNATGSLFTQPVGLPNITSHITIDGKGAVINRTANAPAFSLMAVEFPGDLRLQAVTLSGGSGGGAVLNFAGRVSINNSTISGNSSSVSGGGLYGYYGSIRIENSTISGNTAAVDGGGVHTRFGDLTIINSTISGNVANHGGGVYRLTFFNYDSFILRNSLIAGNQATIGPEIENTGFVTANYFNLFGINGVAGIMGFTPGPKDIVPSVSLAQILDPLQDNGGPTDTHALVAGSPAINAGNPSGCRDGQGALLPTDQRFFSRPFQGTNCDIGSYEVQTGPVTIGATTLAIGEIGIPFSANMLIAGGVAPYIVSITNGRLPAGLSVGNDGIISGVLSPNAKSEKFTMRITDSLNESVSQNFTISVVKAVNIVDKTKPGRAGKDYKASSKIKGGRGPFSWSITAGVLPAGLSFDSSTGAIFGVPMQVGEFLLTVQVTDALGGVDTGTVTLRIK
jgi:hypothetical protein